MGFIFAATSLWQPLDCVADSPLSNDSLSQDSILEVIRRNKRGIQACYENELQQRPDLEGKVVVRLTVDLDGAVTEYEIENSTIGSSEVDYCILTRIRRWVFPKPDGEPATFSLPFVFTQAGGPGSSFGSTSPSLESTVTSAAIVANPKTDILGDALAVANAEQPNIVPGADFSTEDPLANSVNASFQNLLKQPTPVLPTVVVVIATIFALAILFRNKKSA